mgnify:CR=1 FL=1
MIYDLFASIVERHFKRELRHLLEKAKLFVFPGAAKDILPRSMDQEITRFLRENFVLPFPAVAVEDPSSCVILYDLEKGQKGIGTDRGYVECLPMTADSKSFREYGAMPQYDQVVEDMKQSLPADAAIITVGRLSVIETTPTAWLAHGEIEWQAVCTKKVVLMSPEDLEPYRHMDEYIRPALVNAMTAIEEVLYFNTPNRFVLEETPTDGTQRGKVKIQRSHQRSKFTLLTPKEIRERLKISTAKDNRKSPAAHERRRHYRTLRAERFKNMKGRTLVIPATWVGPAEATIGNRIYRVRLDI